MCFKFLASQSLNIMKKKSFISLRLFLISGLNGINSINGDFRINIIVTDIKRKDAKSRSNLRNADDLKFNYIDKKKIKWLQMFPVSHALIFTLLYFVLLHMLMISLKPPFSCWDASPHLQCCRMECCQKQTDDLKKKCKPFIQLSEHVACHLCATLPHGQCLTVPDSHPTLASHRTWP